MLQFNAKKDIPLVAFALLLLLSFIAYSKTDLKVIDLPTYKSLLDKSVFTSAEIIGDSIILKTDDAVYSIIKDGINLENLLKKVPISIVQEESYTQTIFSLFLFIILISVLLLFGKKEKIKEVVKEREGLKNNKALFDEKLLAVKSDIKFDDVAGIEGVKSELIEVVDFLKSPQKYKDFGIKLPRGVLLVGPPGVGKTLIAKAVAGEANVPFFYQSGASFVQIYVGMGAKRVRELFAIAKEMAPSIIFIDEIDAVGRVRGGSQRNDERDATLNQLLTEMDGFNDNSNVIVIAATNKIDILDEALLRSGRFDRRVFLSLPNLNERKEILKVHLADKAHDIDFLDIAKMSVGFSGASLATLVNEAAIYALNKNDKSINKSHFLAVKDKVLLGKKMLLAYSEEEKQIQATYQAAKALCAYWYEIDFDNVSILSDSYKDIDREIESRSHMLSKIKLYLAGMIATNIFYDETFSNARDDVKKAKVLSHEMVENYAMGEGIIPSQIDSSNILDEAIEDVELFLYKMKDAVKAIEVELLEKESISKPLLKSLIDDFL